MLPLDWLEHIWYPEVEIMNAKTISVNEAMHNKKLVVKQEDKSILYEMK